MTGSESHYGRTVVVTGASGFIGGRLLATLQGRDDLHVRAASRVQRRWADGVDGVVVDLARPESLARACEGADVVVNLAAMPEAACTADPQGALRVNTGGTLAWSAAAANAGAARFVQVSTYKAYGDSQSGTITEETPTSPRSHYAITHRASEDYARAQHPHAVVLRLANGFGAPANDATDCWDVIINQFCRQAVHDRRIVIRSSGLAWRNFIPMGDVTAALEHAATRLPAGTYNVGAVESMTLRQAAKVVARVCRERLGHEPAIATGVPMEGESHAPLNFRVDKLMRSGFRPLTSFEDEVARTLDAAVVVFGGARRA